MRNGYCLRAAAVAILLSITVTPVDAEEGVTMTLAPFKGAKLVFPQGFPSKSIPVAKKAWERLSGICYECSTGGTVGSGVVGRGSTAGISYVYRLSETDETNGSITITKAQWEEYMALKASCK